LATEFGISGTAAGFAKGRRTMATTECEHIMGIWGVQLPAGSKGRACDGSLGAKSP